MYVTDMKNFRIQVFDNNDSFVREWKSSGLGSDKFSETVPGIAIDTNGKVYIVDKINSRVQMFDNTGNHCLVGERMVKVLNSYTNQKIFLLAMMG